MKNQLTQQTALVVAAGAFLGAWLSATAWSTWNDRSAVPAEPVAADDRRESFELDFVEATPDEAPPEAIAAAAEPAADVPEPLGATVVPTAVAAERREAMGGSRRSQADLSASVLDPTAGTGTAVGGIVDLSGLDGVHRDPMADSSERLGALLQLYGRTDVRQCYEQRLKAEPGLSGTWTVRLDIAPDGRTTSANVRGPDRSLAHCIEQKAAGWEFPESGGTISMSKSYTLAPR